MADSLIAPIAWQLHRQPLLAEKSGVDALMASRPMTLLDTERSRCGDFAVIDGVAVLPVYGFLMKRGSGWGDEWDLRMGLRSLESLQATFRQAKEDAAVQSVLFRYDTRGGAVGGLFEFAAEIYASRGVKPMAAIADDWAASGGYLLASAVDRGNVFITGHGLMGSIGATTMRLDATKYDEALGLKYAIFASGDRKSDGNPHTEMSAEEEADLRADIARLGREFEGVVAEYRHLKADAVRAQQAAVFRGADAVAAGLADHVSTYEDVLRKLSAAPTGRLGRTTTMSTQNPGEQPAAPETPAQPQVGQAPNLVLLEKAAEDRQAERAAQITTLCREANLGAIAGTFIAARLTVDQVKVRLADAREIVALCAMENITDTNVAVELIEAGLSIDSVKAKLYDARVKSNGPDIFSRQGPTASTGGIPSGVQHPLVQRCKQLASEDREALAQAGRRS